MKSQRYTGVAIVLHWAIALLIIFNLSLGFFMEGFAPEFKGITVALHISSGITVLALTVVRIIWRLLHRPPPFFATLATWERAAAHAVHFLLYLVMLGMPLTGWAIISAHPPNPAGGPSIWGLFHIVPIAPISHLDATAQKHAHDTYVNAHSIGGWMALALVVLHIGAALKHQFLDREPELSRMGVGRKATTDNDRTPDQGAG
jgi:cytochrome b561